MARPVTLEYEGDVADGARERIDALWNLIFRFESFSQDDSRATFTRLFKDAALVLEIPDDDLARMFKISRPTAGRWTRGDSAPHPFGRKSVFDVLAREAHKKLRAIGGRFSYGGRLAQAAG